MKTSLPAPTAKNINDAHRCARESAENAVEWAIKCGQMLAAKKEELQHGEFTKWIEDSCDFSVRSARLYMKAAEQNGNALPFSSLRQLLSPTAGAEPKVPREKGGQTQADAPKPSPTVESGAHANSTGPRVAKPETTPEQRRVAQEVRESVKRQQEHRQADADPERPDIDDAEEDAALERAEVRAREDRERRVDKILESDDQLAESLKQLTQQSALIGTLETTRDSFMRGKEAITKLLKAEQAKVARLEKKLKSAEDEIEKLRKRIAMTEAA